MEKIASKRLFFSPALPSPPGRPRRRLAELIDVPPPHAAPAVPSAESSKGWLTLSASHWKTLMQVESLAIPEVKLITPRRFGDHRGWFCETYSASKLAEYGISLNFVQDNHSYSAQIGTLRGLHFQAPPHAQDKLVRVTRGRVLDVAVDIRRGSPTYGQYVSAILDAENGAQLLVPKGFAHGFVTLAADTEFLYKVSDTYAPECDAGLIWNDPQLNIDWQLGDLAPVLSEKDRQLPTLADFVSPFLYRP